MTMFVHLIESLRLLASPPETALAWLHDESKKAGEGVVLGVDELALDFDNWAQASWQLVEAGELTEGSHASILALNSALEDIGASPSDWTPNAFTASEKWATIREGASTILRQLENDGRNP